MQAATCATSLTPGTRSSRAISEACNEAGTAARDLPQHLGWQFCATNQALDDRLDRAAAEAVKSEPGHVRVPAKARLIVGPACQQHQHPRASDLVEVLGQVVCPYVNPEKRRNQRRRLADVLHSLF